MVKQNYPQGGNRSDRGGGRTLSSNSERLSPGERNRGRFRKSAVEHVANFWPLALLPPLLVTYCLWHVFAVREGILSRAAVFAGIATAFALNSLFTIWFYKVDKRLAEQQLRRIPEFSLHFWELFCGWPGALYAQRKYHHKWKKTSYMIVFWLYVVLNVLAVLYLLCPGAMESIAAGGLDGMLRLLNVRR